MRKVKWTVESCKAAFERFYEEHGRPPCRAEQMSSNGLPHYTQLKKATGKSLTEYVYAMYPDVPRRWGRIKRWTEETCKTAFTRFYEEHGRPPHVAEQISGNGLPCYTALKKATGKSLSEYLYAMYPDLSSRWRRAEQWTAEGCKAAFERFYEEHERLPRRAELASSNGLPSLRRFRKITGMSFTEYLRAMFPDIPRTRSCTQQWTEESCKAAMKDFFERNGRLPLHKDMTAANRLPGYQKLKRTTGKTLNEFRLKYFVEVDPIYNSGWNLENCKTAFAVFHEKHGRLPGYKDLKNANNLPNYATFKKIVGQTLSEYRDMQFPHIDKNKLWSSERCIAALCDYIVANSRIPTAAEMTAENNLPAWWVFKSAVGLTPRQYLQQEHMDFTDTGGWRLYWNKERILSALDRFVEDNARLPRYDELNTEHGLPQYRTIKRMAGVTFKELCEQRYFSIDEEAEVKLGESASTLIEYAEPFSAEPEWIM